MENLKDKKTDDILEKLVHINRITKVVKGGRRFGFSALVVVGNQAGKIGIAHAKAKQVPDAIKKAKNEGFELGIVRSYFKANSKALAELESDGIMKLIFNKETGEVLGAHIYGLHAADLIQEVSNAISRRQRVNDLAKEVHTHPTLSEVVEVAYKQASLQIKK